MHSTLTELSSLINIYSEKLSAISNDDFSFKSGPGKWSKKEILGHLIDSAQNNIRRFIVAQHEDKPKIIYQQNFWVTASGWQNFDTKDLVQLWILLNKQICSILNHLPEGASEKECMSENLHTIGWLAQDYVKHLKHHMHVVLDMEPFVYS